MTAIATEPVLTDSPAGAPVTARKPERFWELEGIRGLFAMIVVIVHSWQYNGGQTFSQPFLGRFGDYLFGNSDILVGTFFAMSGFVLWRPVLSRMWRGERAPSARQWMTKRLLRVIPIYWFVILIVWSTRNGGVPGDWHDLLEHLTFTQNFDPTRIFYTDGPAWSLGVEMAAYLLFGLSLVGIARLDPQRISRRWRITAAMSPLLILCVGCPAGLWYEVWITHAADNDFTLFFGPLAWGAYFGAGMVLALIHVARDGRRPLPLVASLLLTAAGVTILWKTGHGRLASATGLGIFRLAGMGAVFLLLAALLLSKRSSMIHRFFNLRILVWLGTISYSLYLWHEPILELLGDAHLISAAPTELAFFRTAATLLACAIPIGWMSYRMLEIPAQLLPRLVDRYRETRARVDTPVVRIPAQAPTAKLLVRR